MKNTTRKFLSLLLVFVMLCSMIPATMAASYIDSDDIDWDHFDECDDGGDHDPVYYDCGSKYEYYYCDDCDEEGTLAHHWVYEWDDEDYHMVWCDNHSDCYYWEEDYEEHTFDRYGYCTKCEYDKESISWDDLELEIEKDDNMDGKYYEIDDEIRVSVTATLWDEYDDEVDAADAGYYFYFDWEGDLWGDPDDYDEDNVTGYSYAYPDTALDECEVECTVYIFDENDDFDDLDDAVDYYEVSWTLYSDENPDAEIEVEAEVENTSYGQYFNEVDDGGYDSIEDQIADAIADIDDDYLFEYVTFTNVSSDGGYLDAKKTNDYFYYNCYETDPDYMLGDVCFIPEDDFVGETEFYFTATCYDENDKEIEIDGVIVIDVQGELTGEIIYYMAIDGDNVNLDEDDLYYFWDELYPNGTLKYVQFDSVSSGNLYDDYTSSSKKGTDVEAKSSKCYLNPTGSQIGLDDLTYVPGKNTVSSTINFTAYGTTKKNSTAVTGVDGTIKILYTAIEVPAITYAATDAVTLDADDFTDNYENVMDVTKAPTLQIKFLDVPTDGDLYMNYKVSGIGKVTGTKLTASNIDNYTFSSSKTASRSIEDVTYVPGTGLLQDSITYACYSGTTLKYIGTIDFNSHEPIVINLACSTLGGTFKASDFFNSNNGSLLAAKYIVFGTPSSGTLYKNYSNGTGTKVLITDKFAYFANTTAGYESINKVTFIPSGAGLVEIPFMGILSNGFVNGTVKINVTYTAFTDVPTTSYYYNAVQWAVANGVTTGTSATTFSPNKTCTRAEVVTFLWRAKGCPEPKATTCPFTDVKNDYYYKAMMWAVEQGITTGTSATTFSPDKTCTSAEVVTFLWRSNGTPSVSYTGIMWYSQAVAWANSKNLLSGTAIPFAPNNNAPRSDIVTYLYRNATY